MSAGGVLVPRRARRIRALSRFPGDLEYLPKQWNRNESTDGDITSYTISTSTDGVTFSTVATGTWPSGRATKLAEWPAVDAGFVRLQADTATGSYSNVGALRVGGRIAKPRLRSSFPAAGARYRLINRNSGKAADTAVGASPIGTAVTQQAVSSSAGQLWSFTRTPDGYFTLHNAATGTLLEVGGLSRNDEATTDAQRDIGAPQQQWAVTPTGDGYHILTNRRWRLQALTQTSPIPQAQMPSVNSSTHATSSSPATAPS